MSCPVFLSNTRLEPSFSLSKVAQYGVEYYNMIWLIQLIHQLQVCYNLALVLQNYGNLKEFFGMAV